MEAGAKEVDLLWTPGKRINWNVQCFHVASHCLALCLGTDSSKNAAKQLCTWIYIIIVSILDTIIYYYYSYFEKFCYKGVMNAPIHTISSFLL